MCLQPFDQAILFRPVLPSQIQHRRSVAGSFGECAIGRVWQLRASTERSISVNGRSRGSKSLAFGHASCQACGTSQRTPATGGHSAIGSCMSMPPKAIRNQSIVAGAAQLLA
jgi:hypothetical protein